MSVHDDAEAARRRVHDDAAAELEQRLSVAMAERDEARGALARRDGEYDTLAARVVEQESVIAALRDRIAELENPPASTDPAVLPGWDAPVWRDEFDGDLSQWNVRHDWLTMDTANAVREN